MISVIDKVSAEMPDQVDLQQTSKYIRYVSNTHVNILESAVQNFKQCLVDQQNSKQPTMIGLYPEATDMFLNQTVSSIISKVKQSSKYSQISNIQQIMRVNRDLLFDTATREDRLLAGMKQTLLKGKLNKLKKQVFV